MLANLGETAERNMYYDPHTTLMKLRLFGETLAKVILAMENIKEAYNTSQVDRIQTLRREGLLEKELYDMFDALRKKGNNAAHEAGYGTVKEAQALLLMSFRLGIWFMEVYGDWDFEAPEYVEPEKEEKVDASALQKEYDEKVKQLEAELEKVRKESQYDTSEDKQRRSRISKNM